MNICDIFANSEKNQLSSQITKQFSTEHHKIKQYQLVRCMRGRLIAALSHNHADKWVSHHIRSLRNEDVVLAMNLASGAGVCLAGCKSSRPSHRIALYYPHRFIERRAPTSSPPPAPRPPLYPTLRQRTQELRASELATISASMLRAFFYEYYSLFEN